NCHSHERMLHHAISKHEDLFPRRSADLEPARGRTPGWVTVEAALRRAMANSPQASPKGANISCHGRNPWSDRPLRSMSFDPSRVGRIVQWPSRPVGFTYG